MTMRPLPNLALFPLPGVTQRGGESRLQAMFAFDGDLSDWVLEQNAALAPVDPNSLNLVATGNQLARLTNTGGGSAWVRSDLPAPLDLTTSHLRVRYHVEADQSDDYGEGSYLAVGIVSGNGRHWYDGRLPLTPGTHTLEITSHGLYNTWDDGSFDIENVTGVRFLFSTAQDTSVLLDEVSVWANGHGKARVFFSTDGSRKEIAWLCGEWEKRGWRAQLQVDTDRIGTTGTYLSWENLADLYDRGHGVGPYRGGLPPGYPDALTLEQHQQIALSAKNRLLEWGFSRTADIFTLSGNTPLDMRSGWREFMRRHFRGRVNSTQFDWGHGSSANLRTSGADRLSGNPNPRLDMRTLQRDLADALGQPHHIDQVIGQQALLGFLFHGTRDVSGNESYITEADFITLMDYIKEKEDAGELEVWTVDALMH